MKQKYKRPHYNTPTQRLGPAGKGNYYTQRHKDYSKYNRNKQKQNLRKELGGLEKKLK